MSDAAFSQRHARLGVAMLTAAVAVEYGHRQLIAVAVEPLRREFAASDTQIGGLLAGFSVAYGVFALVIGRIADRANRGNLYAGGVALWSAATAAAAAAPGLVSLFATRVAVGIGQAAAGATNASLLADFVVPERRATAMGIVSLGGTVGTAIGLGVGGYAIGHAGWRTTFAVAGALGVGFALVFLALVREPLRGWSEDRVHEAEEQPSLREVVGTLAGKRSIRHIWIGATIMLTGIMSGAQWAPAFFQRSFEMSESEAGITVGLLSLLATVGVVAGGAAADRLGNRDIRLVLRMPAVAAAFACPITLFAFQSPDFPLAVTGLTIGISLALIHVPTTGAMVQAVSPLRMRSLSAAAMNAVLSLVGFGLGPLFTGVVSDVVGGGDARGLRVGLSYTTLLFLWGALHLWIASGALPKDLAAAGARR